MSQNEFLIKRVDALQVLDSRGDPTIEVTIVTVGNGVGRAIAPAGASRGKYEAIELRDGDPKKYRGKSVYKAIENIVHYIGPAIQGLDSRKQRDIDHLMIQIDGTPNKSRIGANAMIATSLAIAKAAADTARIPLFQYLGGIRSNALPIPMLNIINGGAHAGNELAIQEFLIVPIGFDSFSEALKAAVEIYKELKNILKEKYGAAAINVGDEGGYAPPMKTTNEALNTIEQAIKNSGYGLGREVFISLDAAASQFYNDEKKVYNIDGMSLTTDKLIEFWKKITEEHPILSIEDPFHEEDFESYALLRRELKDRVI
ncbi:MAG TPA: phosphopyruvate hydratase, partial [Ignisphaera sp.]|nr:phosphopyruvate hydratase [Ignisphaera sp.]